MKGERRGGHNCGGGGEEQGGEESAILPNALRTNVQRNLGGA